MPEAAPAPAPAPSVPGYELLRCIGRGSYGEVWLARDGAGGFRAVKVVYRKTFEHDRPFERELSGIRKFEPISRSHPSQVSILQVGRNHDEGYFYYVMELADPVVEDVESQWTEAEGNNQGGTSTLPSFDAERYSPRTLKSELVRRGRLSFRECLDISLALATALEHLHQHGLIHRDIKPSNVIFVQGVPKLADIGLVTDAGASISCVGTEGFLPPEGPGTAQGDLYSLGKVLYEISTGRDRMDFPELPTFVDQVPDKEHLLELNQVFLKACQNEPRRRYQSAREMAADIELLQGGKSLRRARVLEKRLALVRLLAAAAVLVVMAIALAGYLVQQRRLTAAKREQARQENETRIYREAGADKSRRLGDGYTNKGRELEAQGDFGGALLWFSSALNEEAGNPARAAEDSQRLNSFWQRIPAMPMLAVHTGGVHAATFSADGRRIVTAGEDQSAQAWDFATGQPIGPPLVHPTRVLQARLSGDGERVLTIDGNGVARLWHQLATVPVAEKLDAPGRFTFATFSPNGRQFITVMEGKEALIWETSSRRPRFVLKHAERILCAAFGANGRLAAAGSADSTARVWDTETGQPITGELTHEGAVTHLAFSPDGRRVATSDGARARLWSTRSGEPSAFILRHDAAITSLSFSPDGKRLVTAAEDGAVRVWDAISGQSLAPALRHPATVRAAVPSPDGRYIVVVCGEKVWLWNARTFEMVPPVFAHNATVQGAQFSPSGQHLLTASTDGTARVFALDSSPGTPPDGRTPGEWMRWAQLLSGRQVSSNEQVTPIPAHSLRKLWTELKEKSPADFRADELPAWHQQLAEAAERSGDWFAAGFHWERALVLQPGEERFRAGREKARSEQARLETATTPGVEPPLRIPPRAGNVSADLLDLSARYNAALTETWLPLGDATSGNDLSALPRGVQKFGGVEFDVRGIIQVSGGALENLGGRFPREVDAISVGRPCRKIHFLHGAGWSARAGTHIGSYAVDYGDGESRDVKIVFGQNVREWLASPTAPMMTGGAVAWEGSNQAGRTLGLTVRIYQMTWLNPRPAAEVRQIRFKSTMENPAPFLIAITTESPKE